MMGVAPANPAADTGGVAVAPALPTERIAIVDLGSNSARVVVVRRPLAGVLETVAEKRLDLRLATRLDRRSRLSERGIADTIEALAEFARFAREAGAAAINVVATAAIRSAQNRDELVARVHARLGLAIEVLGGAEEAELAAAGALHSLPIRSGIVVDVGGGSTEVARVSAGRVMGAWSLPLGALNASAACLRGDPPKRKQLRALRAFIAEAIAASPPARLEKGEELIATGGSARTLARLAQRQSGHPIARVHGFPLERETLRDVSAFLAAHSLAERCSIDGVRAGRADSIVGGALILDELMRHLRAERLTIAAGGVREGVAMRAFREAAPQPRLVRAAVVENLLRRHGLERDDEDVGEARAGLADRLLAKVVDDPFSDIVEAAHLAAMALPLGERGGRKGAGERAAAVLLGEDLAGFDHTMLARTAAILQFSDGKTKASEALLALLPAGERRLLRRAAALLP